MAADEFAQDGEAAVEEGLVIDAAAGYGERRKGIDADYEQEGDADRQDVGADGACDLARIGAGVVPADEVPHDGVEGEGDGMKTVAAVYRVAAGGGGGSNSRGCGRVEEGEAEEEDERYEDGHSQEEGGLADGDDADDIEDRRGPDNDETDEHLVLGDLRNEV